VIFVFAVVKVAKRDVTAVRSLVNWTQNVRLGHIFSIEINGYPNTLKMLGLYLDTLLIVHTLCCIISILNEITLQTRISKKYLNIWIFVTKTTITKQ